MEYRGVKIGDKFINTTDRKSKRLSTVIDFSEKKSMLTGETIEILCIAEKEFMGQTLRFEVVPVTVLRNKIDL